MKSYNNLYDETLDRSYIEDCFFKASKGKRNRRDVADILDPAHLPKHVERVHDMMESESFVPGNHEIAIINESSSRKTRRIVKPNYAYEQVIHHMFVGQFAPVVMHGFYEFSCGSIPKRGVHYAKRYIEKWIHKRGKRRFYVLKMDIRHFYDSIDRDILKAMLRKDIRDDRFYRLACKIIDYDGQEHGRGLPLGFYSSQWFANYYLKKMDHFIKQQLGAENYLRYVDDMVIFSNNRRKLHKMREAISVYLSGLRLELKDNWQVFRFEDDEGKHGRALDFLGFVFHRNRTTIRKSILRSARRKANRTWKVGKPTWYSATQMLSYCGWFFRASAYGYFKKYILSKVSIRKLKKVVSKHSKEKQYEKLARSNIRRYSGTDRHNDIPDYGLPAQGCPEGDSEGRQGRDPDRVPLPGEGAHAYRVREQGFAG